MCLGTQQRWGAWDVLVVEWRSAEFHFPGLRCVCHPHTCTTCCVAQLGGLQQTLPRNQWFLLCFTETGFGKMMWPPTGLYKRWRELCQWLQQEGRISATVGAVWAISISSLHFLLSSLLAWGKAASEFVQCGQRNEVIPSTFLAGCGGRHPCLRDVILWICWVNLCLYVSE